MWPDRRILDLFGIAVPILQAPMAGAQRAALAIAAAEGGGLGALPCALLSPTEIRADVAMFRATTRAPINLNFFCHEPPAVDEERMATWRLRLSGLASELGLDPAASVATATRTPFDAGLCALVEELRPEVVSFHFGLPAPE